MKKINQIVFFIFSLLITCLSCAMLPPLHRAAFYGNLEQVQSLLNAGANVNAVDKYGFTPLHRAAGNGQGAVVNLLLERGADMTLATQEGETPLSVAERRDHKEIAPLLKNWAAKSS